MAIGVDLGGTNVRAALIEKQGKVLKEVRRPTPVIQGPEAVIDTIEALVREVSAGVKVEGVGVGSPGAMDPVDGKYLVPPFNLPGLKSFPLAKVLRDRLQLPVRVDNDANATALGEYVYGAGKGSRVMVLLTLGTGIGGGLVMDGRVYRGMGNAGAEFGHIVVETDGRPCSCGNRGCMETYASASSTARRARDCLEQFWPSKLHEMTGRDPSKVTSKMVVDAAKAGDSLALDVWRGTCKYLAVGIGSYINILNPTLMILAGGMAQAGDFLIDGIHAELKKGRVLEAPYAQCRLAVASLGEQAGILGDAALIWEET